jgi:hypothetical protein
MRWRRRVVLAAVLAAGCGGGGQPSAPAGSVAIIYSGNVDGEIEPCG